jgi:hypothetical protein
MRSNTYARDYFLATLVLCSPSNEGTDVAKTSLFFLSAAVTISTGHLMTSKDSLIQGEEALARNPDTGEIIGENEVRMVFEDAYNRINDAIMSHPECTGLTMPCGHWQAPLDGIGGALQKSADGCLQFGIQKGSRTQDFELAASSDSNTIAFSGQATDINEETDSIANAWHESQHANHPSGGPLNNCDHAELYFATEKLLVAMALCDVGFPSAAYRDTIQQAVNEYTEKCSH